MLQERRRAEARWQIYYNKLHSITCGEVPEEKFWGGVTIGEGSLEEAEGGYLCGAHGPKEPIGFTGPQFKKKIENLKMIKHHEAEPKMYTLVRPPPLCWTPYRPEVYLF